MRYAGHRAVGQSPTAWLSVKAAPMWGRVYVKRTSAVAGADNKREGPKVVPRCLPVRGNPEPAVRSCEYRHMRGAQVRQPMRGCPRVYRHPSGPIYASRRDQATSIVVWRHRPGLHQGRAASVYLSSGRAMTRPPGRCAGARPPPTTSRQWDAAWAPRALGPPALVPRGAEIPLLMLTGSPTELANGHELAEFLPEQPGAQHAAWGVQQSTGRLVLMGWRHDDHDFDRSAYPVTPSCLEQAAMSPHPDVQRSLSPEGN